MDNYVAAFSTPHNHRPDVCPSRPSVGLCCLSGNSSWLSQRDRRPSVILTSWYRHCPAFTRVKCVAAAKLCTCQTASKYVEGFNARMWQTTDRQTTHCV